MPRHLRPGSLLLLARKCRRLRAALLIFGCVSANDWFQSNTLNQLVDIQERKHIPLLMGMRWQKWAKRKNNRGDLRHEHRGPWTTFSVADCAQSHCNAAFLPQEHLACEAQTQLSGEADLPQQEVGWTIFSGDMESGSSSGRSSWRCRVFRCGILSEMRDWWEV